MHAAPQVQAGRHVEVVRRGQQEGKDTGGTVVVEGRPARVLPGHPHEGSGGMHEAVDG